MAATLTAATSALPPTTQFTADESVAVTDAFSSYSTAQTGVLTSLSNSANVVNQIPAIGPPVTAAVQVVAMAVDVSRNPSPHTPPSWAGDGDGADDICTQPLVPSIVGVLNPDAKDPFLESLGSLRDALGALTAAYS
jgi:hypothetical protein